jgi:tetratricopeptide (TPR) repeat protein
MYGHECRWRVAVTGLLFGLILVADPVSRLDRARAFLAVGDEASALVELKAALQEEPNNLFALGNAGLICARRGQFKLASDYLTRAHRIKPADNQLALALLEVFARSDRKREAEQLAADIKLNTPLQRSQRTGAARLLLRLGSFDAAASMLKTDSAAGIDQHDLLGAIYAAKGDVRKASDEWQESIRLAPDDPERYFRLGILYLKYRTPSLAVIVFRHGIERLPTSALLWTGLGISQCLDEKLDPAEQSLETAIKLNPRFTDAYLLLGDILEQEKPREALEVFRRTIAAHPDLPIAYYYYGRLALQLGVGSIDNTIRALRKATALEPGFAEAHYELGRALEEAGKVDEAVTQFEQCLHLDPKLFKAQYRLAILYKKRGESDRAAKALSAFKQAQQSQAPDTELKQLDYQISRP